MPMMSSDSPRPFVLLKGEDFDEESGDDVGPVGVSDSGEARIEEDHGWLTRSDGRRLAERLGYVFEIDGPTDDELDAIRRAYSRNT
jgi:hypothetical protein